MLLVALSLYLTLGACVAPQRLVPYLLALASIVYVAKQTYATLEKVKNALIAQLDRVEDLGKGLRDDAAARQAALDDALRDEGFNPTQILLITVAT